MDKKELNEIRTLMKKIFISCFIIYSLFSVFVFIVFKDVLSNMAKFLVITFAPLLICLVFLGIAKRRHIKPDETPIEDILEDADEPENNN